MPSAMPEMIEPMQTFMNDCPGISGPSNIGGKMVTTIDSTVAPKMVLATNCLPTMCHANASNVRLIAYCVRPIVHDLPVRK